MNDNINQTLNALQKQVQSNSEKITDNTIQVKVNADKIDYVRDFNSDIIASTNTTLVHANNVIDSIDNFITIGAIIIAILSVGLQIYFTNKNKKETTNLLMQYLDDKQTMQKHMEKYFEKDSFKELLAKKVVNEIKGTAPIEQRPVIKDSSKTKQ